MNHHLDILDVYHKEYMQLNKEGFGFIFNDPLYKTSPISVLNNLWYNQSEKERCFIIWAVDANLHAYKNTAGILHTKEYNDFETTGDIKFYEAHKIKCKENRERANKMCKEFMKYRDQFFKRLGVYIKTLEILSYKVDGQKYERALVNIDEMM